jgi:hypothetical protein
VKGGGTQEGTEQEEPRAILSDSDAKWGQCLFLQCGGGDL